MKKLVFTLIVLIAFSAQAQERMNLTPEQTATLRSKEMTLKLDLNDEQQKQIYSLLKETATNYKKQREKRNKEASDEEKYEARVARLDSQITMQAKMKSILDENQFESWKKSSKKRSQRMNAKRKKGEKEHKEQKKRKRE